MENERPMSLAHAMRLTGSTRSSARGFVRDPCRNPRYSPREVVDQLIAYFPDFVCRAI